MAKFKFDIPQEKEKPKIFSFKLLNNEIELIESYTSYLSHKHKEDVTKEVVLRGLLKPLSKDKEYLEFLKKESSRIGAVSEKKEAIKKSQDKLNSQTKIEELSV